QTDGSLCAGRGAALLIGEHVAKIASLVEQRGTRRVQTIATRHLTRSGADDVGGGEETVIQCSLGLPVALKRIDCHSGDGDDDRKRCPDAGPEPCLMASLLFLP